MNRRACRRPQQAEARASGFSHHKEWLESRVTIDPSERNGADMNGADGGKLLQSTVVYTEVNYDDVMYRYFLKFMQKLQVK